MDEDEIDLLELMQEFSGDYAALVALGESIYLRASLGDVEGDELITEHMRLLQQVRNLLTQHIGDLDAAGYRPAADAEGD